MSLLETPCRFETLERRLLMARPDPNPAEHILFRLPLDTDTTTHFYYDRDDTTSAHAWDGSTHTYDGHHGSDFSGGPRGKPVYAAADGILIYKEDGWPDQGGTANGNYVRINHGNDRNGLPINSVYLHFNAGTVTTKALNSFIAAGEQIGGVGTSGNSTGLHLHFEPQINHVAFDPFAAPGSSEKSWWVNQGSGSPSTIANTNKLSIGDTAEAYELAGGTLNVRNAAAGSTIGTRTDGMIGTVLAGPVWAAFNNDFANSLWVWYRIQWSDGLVGWSVQNWLREHVDTTPPGVQSANLLVDGLPHKLEVTFNEEMLASSISAGDIQVTRLSDNQPVNSNFTFSPATRKVTLNFGAQLADGNYRVRIPAGAVSDALGNATTTEYSTTVFVQTADANRDRFVNTLDFNLLAGNFGKTGATSPSTGDFNYDGRVNAIDFNAIASRWGTYMAAPLPGGTVPRLVAPSVAAAKPADLFGQTRVSKQLFINLVD